MVKYLRLRSKLKELNMKHSDYATCLNKSRTYIENRLNGKNYFDTADIEMTAELIKISPAECYHLFFNENQVRGAD